MAFQPTYGSQSTVTQPPAGGSEDGGEQPGQPPPRVKQKLGKKHHFKGVAWLGMYLAFHFICFVATISMGLGVGIISLEMHELCWGTPMDPFWATYVMVIFVYVAVQLYSTLVFNTKFYNWGRKIQVKYRIELFVVPRTLYVILYIVAVANLYVQYDAVHHILHNQSKLGPSTTPSTTTTTLSATTTVSPFMNATTTNSTNLTTTSTTTTTIPTTTTPEPDNIAVKDAPIARLYDDYEHSTLFITSMAYMMYAITKENDWLTYRLIQLNKGEADPYKYGNLSNLLFLLLVHLVMTLFYSLPLIGWSFMMFKLHASAGTLFFTLTPIAAAVGVFASVSERRNPFPTTPMEAPTYPLENHFRVRMLLIHLWLIPLAAGRYFNSNWTRTLDASNYDFLVFCIEIGVGVVQASKVISNDIWLIYQDWGFDDSTQLPRATSTQTDFLFDTYGEFEDSITGEMTDEAAENVRTAIKGNGNAPQDLMQLFKGASPAELTPVPAKSVAPLKREEEKNYTISAPPTPTPAEPPKKQPDDGSESDSPDTEF